jgi:hypothetical protein
VRAQDLFKYCRATEEERKEGRKERTNERTNEGTKEEEVNQVDQSLRRKYGRKRKGEKEKT